LASKPRFHPLLNAYRLLVRGDASP
jgi:hypothetical protein